LDSITRLASVSSFFCLQDSILLADRQLDYARMQVTTGDMLHPSGRQSLQFLGFPGGAMGTRR
jgi:hypothetical protein